LPDSPPRCFSEARTAFLDSQKKRPDDGAFSILRLGSYFLEKVKAVPAGVVMLPNADALPLPLCEVLAEMVPVEE
jgi:hypothetical protein